jgi:hypothetical protein
MTLYLRTLLSILIIGIFPSSAATVYWLADANSNWNTAASWSSNPALPGAGDDVIFNAAHSGRCNVNINTSVNSITLEDGYTGIFQVNNNITLSITGNADFSSGGTFSIGGGGSTIEFSGGAAQDFIPHGSSGMCDITQNGAGGTTVKTNTLNCNDLRVTSGTFTTETAITPTTVTITSTLTLGADMTASGGVTMSGGTLNCGAGGYTHSTTGITGGSGTVNFSSSTLRITGGTANFSGMTIADVNGILEFTSGGGQTMTPEAGQTFPDISVVKTGNTLTV